MDGMKAMPPRPRDRMTGVVYLLYFLTAISAELFVGSGRHDAYQAVNLIAYGLYIVVTLLFYNLFKPVNRILTFLAALFSLFGCAIGLLGFLALAPHQLSPLLFFGPYCLLLGYLIFTSTFLSRILGVLLALAGLGWVVFLTPLETHLSTFLKVFGFLSELLLCLWLTAKGVNVQRWNHLARSTEQHH